MATKGSVSTSSWTSKYGYTRYITFNWERTSFNVEQQTSTIKWSVVSGGSFDGQVKSGPFYVYLDGTTLFYDDGRYSLYSGTTLGSGTTTLYHNSDGTKSFTIAIGAAIYSSAISNTGSATFTLDIVGKATLTGAPSFTDEGSPTITYKNPVGNAVTKLEACISLDGSSPDVPYRDVPINGTSYTFNLSDTERDTLRAATTTANSRKVKFFLQSTIEGKLYRDWKEVNFSVINSAPTLTCSVEDVNTNTTALTGDATKLVKYHSTAKATISGTAKKKATIASTSIASNGITSTDASKMFFNITSNEFKFVVTDSRGNSANKTLTPTMVAYVPLTANIVPSGQMTTDGNYTLKMSGNYFNGSFGAVSNTLAVQYRYRLKDEAFTDSDWKTITVTKSGNTYSAEVAITGLNYRETYKFQVKAVDKLNTVLSAEELVSSLPVFHWSKDDFVFEVPVQFKAGFEGEGGSSSSGNIEGDANISGSALIGNHAIVDGDIRIDGAAPNTLFFGSGDYPRIQELTTDDLLIKANAINLEGTVSINGKPIVVNSTSAGRSGVWTPALGIASAVSSYTIQQGWFSWVGDVINIGFNIKATIKSGYDAQTIVITGCPFYPLYSAFGGGIAHNIQFAAGYNFEGWCLDEADAFIRPRGQPCNNTTKTPLQITSTAYYPTTNGTVVSLAGSICLTASGAG